MKRGESLEIIDEEQCAIIDREFRTALASMTGGTSPIEMAIATLDWIAHLSISPGTRLRLAQSFCEKAGLLSIYSLTSLFGNQKLSSGKSIDAPFDTEDWQHWPFNTFAKAHQLSRTWVEDATSDIDGVREEHLALVQTAANQVLDLFSPANHPLTNPSVVKATLSERGRNLARGLNFLVKDHVLQGSGSNQSKQDGEFLVGETLAITPGKVIFENSLMELIKYDPLTEEVGAEPILITPAWIMKYYIMDLSPHNSLVRYLVEQGKTVFMISWKNPTAEDKHVSFEDYIELGIYKALDVVAMICPRVKVHAVGYCLGGSLLSIAAAALAKDGNDRLQTISLFAAQTDFSEAGEIARFVSPSSLSFLEKVMWKRGFLTSKNMSSAFVSLRATELLYQPAINRYLLGKETAVNDLIAWNADGTRMPYQMHMEYLTSLYLENRLARNQFKVRGKAVSMSDIRVPMFVLGTESDHLAPWKSVYKTRGLTNTELAFVLTNGGHNTGVIAGPENKRRRFRISTRQAGDAFMDPETWLDETKPQNGSWWQAWNKWLDDRMSQKANPPQIGSSSRKVKIIREAPGKYIFG